MAVRISDYANAITASDQARYADARVTTASCRTRLASRLGVVQGFRSQMLELQFLAEEKSNDRANRKI
jgi:hypothetical protein